MSNDLNQCQFIGRLGKDPETRYLPNGDAVTNFSIAVGKSWKDKDGEKQERTEWVRCVAFKKLAELAGQYLEKGKQCFVSGEMSTRKWTNKEGQDVYTTEITVNNIQFLGGKSEPQGSQAPTARPAPSRPPAPSGTGFDDMDDDLPF